MFNTKMNIFHINCNRLYGFLHKHFTCTRLLVQRNSLSRKNKFILILGVIPVIPTVSAQTVVETKENSSIIKSGTNDPPALFPKETPLALFPDEKTPWERVRAIYETDEFGNYSKELTATFHCCYLAVMVGVCYGGVQKSRIAFTDFMERNQSTLFDNHLDAKRKLQNHVTIHFGKGAFQWAWRLSSFTGGFMLSFLTLHAYRGTSSIIDYALSGALVGTLMRVKLGPPGMIIGGAVGGIMGLLCGVTNQGLLSLFGTSLDDILALQYKIDRDRAMAMEKTGAQYFEEKGVVPQEVFEILKERENRTADT